LKSTRNDKQSNGVSSNTGTGAAGHLWRREHATHIIEPSPALPAQPSFSDHFLHQRTRLNELLINKPLVSLVLPPGDDMGGGVKADKVEQLEGL
jgi:hypothetical protein